MKEENTCATINYANLEKYRLLLCTKHELPYDDYNLLIFFACILIFVFHII